MDAVECSLREDESATKVVAGEWRPVIWFLAMAYVVALVETTVFFGVRMQVPDTMALSFVLAVLLTYPLIYIVPAGMLLAMAVAVSKYVLPTSRRWRWKLWIPVMVAMVAMAFTQIFIFADYKIFAMFGFHFNGFVWNLITTPGGLRSMEAGNDLYAYLAGLVMLALAFNAGLWWLAKTVSLRTDWRTWRMAKVFGIALISLFILGFYEHMLFGYAFYKAIPSVVYDSRKVPFYIPVTYKNLAERLGLRPGKRERVVLDAKNASMKYPSAPIKFHKPEKPFNIVWLVAESWRADTLTSDIMPATSAFAETAWRFENHYSAGNGTRMGIFGLFYGLYGNYWFPALSERKSPILMRVLKAEGYQFDLYTSANFHFPRMDKTAFLDVPREHLHSVEGHDGWVDDRANITSMLDFIAHRGKDRPFMAFMFFLSPHAPYTFPEECVIRKDYLPHINYATVDVEKEIGRIKNRYINAVHHLDTQMERVFEFLKKEDLLKNTIVIITGDHGEEFLEAGHWGHNSGFHQGEVKPPMIIYVPGKGHGIYTGISSHLDIPATLAPLIGIENPPSDYSFGIDLFSSRRREYTVVSNWEDLCYVDDKYKYTIPAKYSVMADNKLTTVDDKAVGDKNVFFSSRRERLSGLLMEANRFRLR